MKYLGFMIALVLSGCELLGSTSAVVSISTDSYEYAVEEAILVRIRNESGSKKTVYSDCGHGRQYVSENGWENVPYGCAAIGPFPMVLEPGEETSISPRLRDTGRFRFTFRVGDPFDRVPDDLVYSNAFEVVSR